MKKAIFTGFIIGLLLGILQVVLVYTKTAPSLCFDATGEVCVSSEERNFYRGWPLNNVGQPGFNDSFHNPPIVSKTYVNIPIVIGMTVILSLLVFALLSSLRLSRSSYRILSLGILVGLLLGLSQIFYTQKVQRQSKPFDMSNVIACDQKVPGCGYCPEGQKNGNLCNLPPYEQTVRGWPLRHDTYDTLSRYDKSPTLALNIIIIMAGTTLLTGMTLLFSRKR